MNRKKVPAIIILIVCTVIFSCRRDSSESIRLQDVCSITSGEWFPLKVGDEWLIHVGGYNIDVHDEFWQITEIDTFSGRIYYKEIGKRLDQDVSFAEYFRKDSTGNIYMSPDHQLGPAHESLCFPANPILGSHIGTATIVSVDSTITVQGCTQEHLLVTLDSAALPVTKYFKRGVGVLADLDYFSSTWVTKAGIH